MHKRNTYYATKFEMNFEKELLNLSNELKSHTYHPSRAVCFAISDPKLREVWAANFRDRVVHHLLIGFLEPIWERMFVFTSYACRSRKGAHRAVSQLKKSANSKLHFLQIDIQSFFVSINKTILFSLIKKRVRNPEILWLTEKIVFHDPTKNYIARGDLKLLKSVPLHKSLFGKIDCGLPIGNLTSQFFANIYLNELDQFIKHNLKCHRYFRYMDDLLILHSSREQLVIWRNKIRTFVENKLKLKLHPKKQIFQPIKHGSNFCGYIIKPDCTFIRQRTVKKLKNKLWRFNQIYSNELVFNNLYAIFDNQKVIEDFKHIFSSINSSYGFFKHADCNKLKRILWKKHFGILKQYLNPANRTYDYFVWKSPET